MRPDVPQLHRYGGRKRPGHSSAQSGGKQDTKETGESQTLGSPNSTPIPQQEPPDDPPVLSRLSQWKLIISSLSKIKEQGTHEWSSGPYPSQQRTVKAGWLGRWGLGRWRERTTIVKITALDTWRPVMKSNVMWNHSLPGMGSGWSNVAGTWCYALLWAQITHPATNSHLSSSWVAHQK